MPPARRQTHSRRLLCRRFFLAMRRTLAREREGIQALQASDFARAGIRVMRQSVGPLTTDGQMSHQAMQARSRGEKTTDMAEPARAKPKPTPETQHVWDGTQANELRLQR